MLTNKMMGAILIVGVTFSASSFAQASKECIAYLRLTTGYWQVWLACPEESKNQGYTQRQITKDTHDKTRMSWSKDRTSLLVNTLEGKLQLVNVDDGKVTHLELSHSSMLDAQWSPDNKQISYSIQSTQIMDNNDLWVSSMDGKNKTKLTNDAGVSHLSAWSQDSYKIAYVQNKMNKTSQLWQVDVRNGNKQQLTVGSMDFYDPNFNDQGDLAYTANKDNNYDIWIRKSSGKTIHFTHSELYEAQPSWSLDGKAIAFYSHKGQQRRIWVKYLDTGTTIAVTPEHAHSRLPVWH